VNNDALTFSIVTNPSHGKLVKKSATVWTYTSDAEYIGSDSFTYKAGDGQVTSDSGSVAIIVTFPPPPSGALTIDCGKGVTMTLVTIPSGVFLMGTNSLYSSDGIDLLYDAKPVHQVTISRSFYMGIYEVTIAQYNAVMGTNYSGALGQPIRGISWGNAVDFCKILSQLSGKTIRLPSEAEWEYACKADKGNVDMKYYFGNDDSQLGTYAWYSDNSNKSPHSAGLKKPNSFGLYDMLGNAREWCKDWYESTYSSGSVTDPTGPSTGTKHVRRGGAYQNDSFPSLGVLICRSYERNMVSGGNGVDIGFRVIAEK
jgi:formylglycine-generating enzyme required for sulfatase activity